MNCSSRFFLFKQKQTFCLHVYLHTVCNYMQRDSMIPAEKSHGHENLKALGNTEMVFTLRVLLQPLATMAQPRHACAHQGPTSKHMITLRLDAYIRANFWTAEPAKLLKEDAYATYVIWRGSHSLFRNQPGKQICWTWLFAMCTTQRPMCCQM